MGNYKVFRSSGLLLALWVANLAFAEGVVHNGKVNGDFRLRYERVDIDSHVNKDAGALTLRSRLGYETESFNGLSGKIEFEDTRIVGAQDEYGPLRQGYANIVDLPQTQVNQAYLHYQGLPVGLAVKLGRQRIVLDNERFVGSSNFRQNEQTFDALSANVSGLADWNITYAYINSVHGIAELPPVFNFSFKSDDHLLHVAYTGFSAGKVTGYGYRLANKERDINQLNPGLRYHAIDTYGLRFEGTYPLAGNLPLHLVYTAEAAAQTYTALNLTQYDTHYGLVELGVAYHSSIGPVALKIAQETLGSDQGQQGFETPYASKGAFSGGTDMFLETPNRGLVRQYLTLAGELSSLNLKYVSSYAHYRQEEGDQDFGSGWNIMLIKPIAKQFDLGVTYAEYAADKGIATIVGPLPNIDTVKYALWCGLRF